ncbi:thrombospondin type-1 domain-containing protein 4 [Synchiropus splendidus]|uniref:thrombospondin type-1 domain-containing protein 4 n=1 Tax=Synchiropus splendidus TaxID=270530 RepID=UPI00237D4576|nr:thrombospondin type-1 domain-containing protein 4 [Synchiropus splendidus]
MTPLTAASVTVSIMGHILSKDIAKLELDTEVITKGFDVLKGNFSRTFLRVGYHKVTVIPAGACNISIKEAVKTRNYIALKTHTGDSIINGNWVIDKPGIFAALGTQFTYRRPNEIRSRTGESISATGPLTDDLHVYLIYQQPGVRVYYEYLMPLKTTRPPPQTTTPFAAIPQTSTAARTVDKGVNGNEILSETLKVVPSPLPTYIWIKAGYTECSSSCGTGWRQMILQCVAKDSMMTVSAHFCDAGQQPTSQEEVCNTEPCPAYWDVGEWSECSKRCGPGTQLRQVICRQVTSVQKNGTENSVTVASELCGTTDRPATSSTCQMKICSQWEIRSEWSACSVPCGLGQRSRQVVCVSNQGEVEEDQECNMNLKPDALENCDMGACARSWFTSLWSEKCSATCGKGAQTRRAVCLRNHVSDLPLDSCDGERPLEEKPCDSGPCQKRLEWYSGPWSQCSAECGNGTQTRTLACILNNNSLMEVVDHSRCSHLPQQVTVQPCMLKPCGVQWYVTEWSECSLPCGGGFRVREVRCLTDSFAPSDLCDANIIPGNREECNTHPCKAEITPSCSDQNHNCVVVVQARLCVYNYYRSICCASCAKAQKAYPYSSQKNHIRR